MSLRFSVSVTSVPQLLVPVQNLQPENFHLSLKCQSVSWAWNVLRAWSNRQVSQEFEIFIWNRQLIACISMQMRMFNFCVSLFTRSLILKISLKLILGFTWFWAGFGDLVSLNFWVEIYWWFKSLCLANQAMFYVISISIAKTAVSTWKTLKKIKYSNFISWNHVYTKQKNWIILFWSLKWMWWRILFFVTIEGTS